MKYLIGKKIGMTQRFLADGTAVTVTGIQAGPCKVTAVKSLEKDGYVSVQIGFDEKKKLSKAEAGHLKGLPAYSCLQEFPAMDHDMKKGDELLVTQFAVGDLLDITGTSKGKGFQGVVKRHHFGGSKKTHGNKDQLRMPGSVGSTGPAHIFKGMRMAGRMGNETVTTKNLEVVEVVPEEGLLFVKGAVPGPNSGIVSLFSLSTTQANYEKPKAKEEPKETENVKSADTPAVEEAPKKDSEQQAS